MSLVTTLNLISKICKHCLDAETLFITLNYHKDACVFIRLLTDMISPITALPVQLQKKVWKQDKHQGLLSKWSIGIVAL